MLGTPLDSEEDDRPAPFSAAQRIAPSLQLFARAKDATTGSTRRFTGAFEGGFLRKGADDGYATSDRSGSDWTPATFVSSRARRAQVRPDGGDGGAVTLESLLDEEDRRAGVGQNTRIAAGSGTVAGVVAVMPPVSLGHEIMRQLGWSHADAYRADGQGRDLWRGPGKDESISDVQDFRLSDLLAYAAKAKNDKEGIGYDKILHGGEDNRLVGTARRDGDSRAVGAKRSGVLTTTGQVEELLDDGSPEGFDLYGDSDEHVLRTKRRRGLSEEGEIPVLHSSGRAVASKATQSFGRTAGLPNLVPAVRRDITVSEYADPMIDADFESTFNGHTFETEEEQLKKWKLPRSLVREAQRVHDADLRRILHEERPLQRKPDIQDDHATSRLEKKHKDAIDRFVSAVQQQVKLRFAPEGTTVESTGEKDASAKSKVAPGMVRRTKSSWQPSSLLCKRFNVKVVPQVADARGDARTSAFMSAGHELDTSLQDITARPVDVESGSARGGAAAPDVSDREIPDKVVFKSIFGDSSDSGTE